MLFFLTVKSVWWGEVLMFCFGGRMMGGVMVFFWLFTSHNPLNIFVLSQSMEINKQKMRMLFTNTGNI